MNYRYIINIIIFTCLLASSNRLYSQSDTSKNLIHTKHFSVEEGLASREVICGTQDKRGFIWFATRNGLNRFDGKIFKLYTENNGMQGRKVIEMAEDNSGFIWLLYGTNGYGRKSNNRVDLMDIKTNEFIPFSKKYKNAPFKEKDISWLKSNGKGEIFFWIKPNFYYLYSKNSGFIKVAENSLENFRDYRPEFDAIDEQSGLLFFKKHHMAIWDKSKTLLTQQKSTYKPLKHINDDKWIVLYTKGEGEKVALKIVSREGIAPLSDNIIPEKNLTTDEKTFTFYDPKTNSAVIYSIGKGVYFYNKRVTLLSDDIENIKDNSLSIYYYFSDGQGRIWLCTSDGVLMFEIKQNKFTHFFSKSNMVVSKFAGNQARGIIEDKRGYIYGQIWGQFLKCNAASPLNVNIKKGKGILYALITIKDTLISSSNDNLLIYDTKSMKFCFLIESKKNFPSNSDEVIWSLYSISNNKLLCGNSNGITVANIAEKNIFIPPLNKQFPEPQFVYQIFRSKDNKIFAVCQNGLFVLNEEGYVTDHYNSYSKRKNHQIPYNKLMHINEDKEGNFWLATDGNGLYSWNRKHHTFQHFTVATGLSSNILYRIEADNYGYLWISSDYGIMRFNPKTFLVNTFTAVDGITHNEFNRVSSYKAADGKMYFGGLDGVNAFYPNDFLSKNENISDPFQITGFSQFSSKKERLVNKTNELLTFNKIVLEPGDKFFNLDFELLDFEEGIHRYAYKIEGIDKDWNYINENTIKISGLPYGNYLLHIKAQNIIGYWSKNEISIPIEVIIPFYKKNWFIILMRVLSITLISIGITYFITKYKRDQAKLELIVKNRTTQLEQTLEQRDTLLKEIHHRVKNNLQVISSLFDLQSSEITDIYTKQLLEEGRGRVRSMALLHHQLYQHEDYNGVKLNSIVHDLYIQVFEVYKKSGINIKFETHIPNIILQIDTAIPLGLILNELFTNAFKYSVYATSLPSINISVQIIDDEFILTYKDNGPGLPPDFNWQKSRSLGIRIIRQLSKQLQGNMEYRYEHGSRFDIKCKNII